MSYQLSDDDSTDSDSGIRFKTTNIRNKGSDHSAYSSHKSSSYNNSERQLRTHRHHRDYRSRDRSRDRRRRSRSSEYRKRSSRDLDKARDERKRTERKKEKSRKTESTTRTNKEIDSVTTEPLNKESKKIKDIEQKNKSPKPPKLSNKKSNDVIISDKNSTKNSLELGLTVPSSLLSDKLEAISDDENICGPALPPHLINKTAESDNSDNNTYAPALPPHLLSNNNTLSPQPILSSSDDDICGPALPPHLTKTPLSTIETPKSDDDDSLCGPALPPHLSNKPPQTPQSTTPKKKVLGPTLPAHLREALQKDPPSSAVSIDDPPEEGEIEEDFDMVGPLPAGLKTKNPSHTQLEERALQIQLDRLNKPADDIKTREEWMLELPKVQAANLGLGPRQFRAKGVPDMSDRSSWTDTPEDKAKKETTKGKEIKIDIKKEAELKRIQERDREQQKQVEKHKKKKKRDKSLLDLHQDEYNKKKKKEAEESGKPERRPFNRDVDLKANRFDEAQKKSILKKAQLLDTRFSAGESKFL